MSVLLGDGIMGDQVSLFAVLVLMQMILLIAAF